MKYLVLLSLFSFTLIDGEVKWLTNFEESQKKAQQNEKLILMSFSGSDWCSNCIRLDKTLFQSEAFAMYAEENLVLLQLDFPAKKKNKLSEEQTQHNEKLAEKYNKKGTFPTVVILNADGEVQGKLNISPKTTEEYMKDIISIVSR